MAQGKVDVQCVQADKLWVKLCKPRLRMALPVAVPSRLWLGGVVGPRKGSLTQALVLQVRRCVRSLAIVVCVDGLPSYVTAFRRVFVDRLPRPGSVGRPRHQRPQGFLMGQVVKQYHGRRMAAVVHRAVVGTVAEITARLQAVGGGQVLNTAYIERLNATFRSRLVWWALKGDQMAIQMYPSLEALQDAIHEFFATFSRERALQLTARQERAQASQRTELACAA